MLIDSRGYIKKSRGDNAHVKNLAPNVQNLVKAIIQRKTNRGEMLPETKTYARDPDGEVWTLHLR